MKKTADDVPGAGSFLSSTTVKNEFGSVLERVIQGERIVITRHESPKAILLSIDDFNRLTGDTTRQLKALSAQFDDQLAAMQTAEARAGVDRAFNATPEELARAAMAAARKHG